MSQVTGTRHPSAISDAAYQRQLDRVAAHPAMAERNIRLEAGTLAPAAKAMLILGVVGLGLTVLGAILQGRLEHALASYQVGVFTILSMSLGSMFFVMVFHSLNASWSVTMRRQFENVMAMMPVGIAMLAVALVIELVSGGVLLRWIGIDPAENYLINHKQPYLNIGFFVARVVVCAGLWWFLAGRLCRYSLEQDSTGDRWLTSRARYTSGWGLLVFALTVAFAAFDWLMAMDYRFFSTMWGVYYFAGAALASLAVIAVIIGSLRFFGRLTHAVTEEHMHDLGKLLFAFVVFWAYIGFSQYFLIWYSNIPEETAFYVYRNSGGWEHLSAILAVGHFIVPFFILIFRPIKRGTVALIVMGAYLLFMHVLDLTWAIRPMANVTLPAEAVPGPGWWWIDMAAAVGVLGVFGFFLLRRIERHPLIPTKDPRLPKTLKHKNYV